MGGNYTELWNFPKPIWDCFETNCGGFVIPIKTPRVSYMSVPDGDNELVILTISIAILGFALWQRQRKFATAE
jgi:hypothetical protein